MEKDNSPPAFDVAKIEERFKNIKTLSDLTGKDGIIQEMIKQTVERILKAEQEAHLGYEPYRKEGKSPDNARGMSTRDIQAQLQEFYGADVSPALISKITDKVLEGVQAWQVRPLDDVYAVVFMDAIHYKIRQDAKVITKAAYTCMGVNPQGRVDVLGLWLAENEGAHFWLTVLNDSRLVA